MHTTGTKACDIQVAFFYQLIKRKITYVEGACSIMTTAAK